MSAAKHESLSESVDWKLIEIIANQRPILIVGGLVSLTVAAFSTVRTGHLWFVWWGIAAVLTVAGRLGVDAAFARRKVRFGRPTAWRRRLLIGSWANGAICGIGGAGSVLASDALTQMLVITMLTAFVMGSASRNGAYPKAAIGSVLLAEMPLLLACLATREIYYIVYTLFIALFTVSAMWVTRHLYTQTVRFLVTDERNAVLVCEASRSNRDLATANEKLAFANQQLAAMAGTDGLTGVPNRRSFDASFEIESRSAQRDGSDLSLLMFDIDFFKGYNDRYGHPAGDECLRRVAQALASGLCRPRDILSRYGGEEFVAILPHTDLVSATALAETLRESIEALGVGHGASAAGVVTLSIGVATFSAHDKATAADLLPRADAALYVAKQSGRNRVRAALDDRSPAAAATT